MKKIILNRSESLAASLVLTKATLITAQNKTTVTNRNQILFLY